MSTLSPYADADAEPLGSLIEPDAVRLPTDVPAEHTFRSTNKRGGIFILIALALIGAVVVFGAVAFDLHHLMAQPPGGSSSNLQAITATPFVVAAATIMPIATDTPAVTAIQPWGGTQRFTMLLMGIDVRPGQVGDPGRTDTMIVISIDPATHSIGMLSVPRDLFVTFPPNTPISNFGLQRINSAYTLGELVRPGSGAVLAMQTVQYNLGIPINAYAVVDFQAVVDLVDAVGGVDIDVPYTINDPAYPDMTNGYDPLYIPQGTVHMDGTLALKYSRSRHQTSDLDRAARQQQIIQAIRDKVTKLDMVPQMVFQAPALWAKLDTDMRTDLTLDQWLQLGLLAKDIPAANIHKAVIDYRYVTPQVYQGADILVPNRTAIATLLPEVFGDDFQRIP